MKHKLSRPGFELRATIPFPFMVTVTLSTTALSLSHIYIYINIKSKFSDLGQERPEGSLFNSNYTEVLKRVLLLFLDRSTSPLIHTLKYRVLIK